LQCSKMGQCCLAENWDCVAGADSKRVTPICLAQVLGSKGYAIA